MEQTENRMEEAPGARGESTTTVLLTGASGFIGQYVVEEILRTTSCRLILAMRDPSLPGQGASGKRVTSLAFDLEQLDPAVNYYDYFERPSTCIHLAWQGLPNYKQLFHFERNLPQHYAFLKNLVTNGLPSLTVTGTCFEYGMKQGCLSEDIPAEPANAYALAKHVLHQFLEELKKETPFALNWIRLFYMYGEGQSPKALFSQLRAAVERGDATFNMSGGEQERDFLPVEEVAKIILTIAMKDAETGLVNCCSGRPVKVKDWVRDWLEKHQFQIKLNPGYYPYADYEPMAFWGSREKLNTVIK